jgi:hypothetical protein
VRTPPTCNLPVGLGAYLTLILPSLSIS